MFHFRPCLLVLSAVAAGSLNLCAQTNPVASHVALPLPVSVAPPARVRTPVLVATPTGLAAEIEGSRTNVIGVSAVDQIRSEKAKKPGATIETVEVSAPAKDFANLEFTGQYMERYVRIPAGKGGETKTIRFLIPVFKEAKH